MINVVNISKKFKCRTGNSFLEKLFRKQQMHKNFRSSAYKDAIKDISFQIEKGEMVGFVGRNGAGKTTLIKMLTGIMHPDSGIITVEGKSPHKQRKEYVADIGVVFGQKTQLNYDFSPMDTYRMLKCIYKIPDEMFEMNLERFIELLDVRDCIHKPVYQLSLGQKMRAEIICALLHSPSILFLDEPTIGIDVVGKEKIRKCLRQLNETDKITVIITSHDMKDIEEACDRVIMLDSGKIAYDGSMEQLKTKYSSKRIMEIELSSSADISIPGILCETVENKPMSRRIYFDKQDVNYNQLISDLVGRYDIKDICVKEIGFEQIIREIYSERSL
ncbi:MAG: ATP-binding cassette domain-containing protein [Lachnospiraceae bacterium]|nr:ATP-binding cassette domain-containing protein [Lachnospiraceae bacterium]